MKKSKAEKKVGKVMGEFKAGTLHSGKGGPVVKNQKQALVASLILSIAVNAIMIAVMLFS